MCRSAPVRYEIARWARLSRPVTEPMLLAVTALVDLEKTLRSHHERL